MVEEAERASIFRYRENVRVDGWILEILVDQDCGVALASDWSGRQPLWGRH